MMPPKKRSKKSSKDNITPQNGPPASTATKPGPSAILDALNHIEELEDGLDEQADGELEEDSDHGDGTGQNKQGQDSAEGEADADDEEEEPSDKDAPVVIPQKRAIKTGAPVKANSLHLTSPPFACAEPFI